jgi:pimeloyl-ACP methyl ester carboxylesterase
MESQNKLAQVLGVKLKFGRTQVGKYSINYVEAGEGSPVLLLHGANIGWPQWYQNIADLAKNFKVYALDLPGAGDSTMVDFHKMEFEEFVGIVDDFIKAHKLDQLDIVGSSFGGWIALRLAIQHKPYIRKIALGNPLGFTTHMPARFRPVSIRPFAVMMTKTALKPVRSNKNLEKFMRDVFFDKQLPLAPEFVDYFYELSKKSHNLLFISRLAHFKGMRKELYLRNNLSKIDKPVLVIWGKEDILMPYGTVTDSIESIPGVRLETLDKIGHMPPVEAPATFNKLVTDYLKK